MDLMLATLLLVAPVTSHQFLMSADGNPLSILTLSTNENMFTYSSTRLLEENVPKRTKTFDLSTGLKPETWVLLFQPQVGCQSVIEEIDEREEKLCILKKMKNEVAGTIDGTPFLARYKANQLRSLHIKGIDFVRVEKQKNIELKQNPFEEGFQVQGTGSHISFPKSLGGHVVSVQPIGESKSSRLRCLLLAREWISKNDSTAMLVLGLVIMGEKAFPHAWVKLANNRFVDPSFDFQGTPLTYIALPTETAGNTYLGLLLKTLLISRSNGP